MDFAKGNMENEVVEMLRSKQKMNMITVSIDESKQIKSQQNATNQIFLKMKTKGCSYLDRG